MLWERVNEVLEKEPWNVDKVLDIVLEELGYPEESNLEDVSVVSVLLEVVGKTFKDERTDFEIRSDMSEFRSTANNFALVLYYLIKNGADKETITELTRDFSIAAWKQFRRVMSGDYRYFGRHMRHFPCGPFVEDEAHIFYSFLKGMSTIKNVVESYDAFRKAIDIYKTIDFKKLEELFNDKELFNTRDNEEARKKLIDKYGPEFIVNAYNLIRGTQDSNAINALTKDYKKRQLLYSMSSYKSYLLPLVAQIVKEID